MKLIITYLLAFLSFIICGAQGNLKKIELMIPTIDKKLEQFNINLFKKEVNPVSSKKINNEDKKTVIEEAQSYGFVREIYYSDSNFSEMKLFYSNGSIKEKGVYFNNGSQCGVWYKFDEEGNLVKEINTDEGYDFGWQEVIAYCEKKEIELTKGYEKGGYQTEILKQEENGKKVWVISYLVSPVLICKETLDGVTGKLLNSEEFEFINH